LRARALSERAAKLQVLDQQAAVLHAHELSRELVQTHTRAVVDRLARRLW
jgi:hypothetical protein